MTIDGSLASSSLFQPCNSTPRPRPVKARWQSTPRHTRASKLPDASNNAHRSSPPDGVCTVPASARKSPSQYCTTLSQTCCCICIMHQPLHRILLHCILFQSVTAGFCRHLHHRHSFNHKVSTSVSSCQQCSQCECQCTSQLQRLRRRHRGCRRRDQWTCCYWRGADTGH